MFQEASRQRVRTCSLAALPLESLPLALAASGSQDRGSTSAKTLVDLTVMKSLMILGGFTGFVLGVFLGLLKDASWPTILWRSSVAALAGGVLLRWWGQIWMKCLREAQRQSQQAGQAPISRPTSSSVASPVNE